MSDTPKSQIGAALDAPIPDVVAPIVGYRAWKWDTQGLHSLRGIDWPAGGHVTAECLASKFNWLSQRAYHAATNWGDGEADPPTRCNNSPSDPVPDDQPDLIHGEYGCGLYAYATLEDAWKNLHADSPNTTIIGEVELWGKVWPHEKGYRAEHARVKALYRTPNDDGKNVVEIADVLADHYGVEVKDMPLGQDQRVALEIEANDERHTRWMASYGSLFGNFGVIGGNQQLGGIASATHSTTSGVFAYPATLVSHDDDWEPEHLWKTKLVLLWLLAILALPFATTVVLGGWWGLAINFPVGVATGIHTGRTIWRNT